MFAKRFFYVCAGLLCLAVAYHLGARNAVAQGGTQPYSFAVEDLGCGRGVWVITANGDLYRRSLTCDGLVNESEFLGNVWGSGPIPTTPETIGRLKARYR